MPFEACWATDLFFLSAHLEENSIQSIQLYTLGKHGKDQPTNQSEFYLRTNYCQHFSAFPILFFYVPKNNYKTQNEQHTGYTPNESKRRGIFKALDNIPNYFP